jgi:hypothetical protein
MIKISLDESYIFDILTIYQIKELKSPENPIHSQNFNKLYSEIALQIGKEKIDLILNSEEYLNLLKANTDTFNLVDAVKTNPCLGREVDESNYNRYLKKVALQSKFFDTKITETKIGY